MKIAILGYGKMGKMVEEIVLATGNQVVVTIDNEEEWTSKYQAFNSAEVAIDFSMPSTAIPNMQRAFEAHVPIVVGTTGWYDRKEEVLALCREHNGSMVYGANFSIGANLFMQLNIALATLMNAQPQYAPSVEETHHVTKKDAPSGTAIRLVQDLIAQVGRVGEWQLQTDGQTAVPGQVPITAHREGAVAGIHSINWYSEEDEITIIHNAHSRKGFALGAVKAALWLAQNPGIYDFAQIALQCSI